MPKKENMPGAMGRTVGHIERCKLVCLLSLGKDHVQPINARRSHHGHGNKKKLDSKNGGRRHRVSAIPPEVITVDRVES